MFDTENEAVLVAVLAVAALVVGVGFVATAAPSTDNAAPDVNDSPDISSHSDATNQSSELTFDLPPATITCEFDTSAMEEYGVTVTDASSSGSDKLSVSFTDGTVEFTIESGSGTETATITITANTTDVDIPDGELNHSASCDGGSPSDAAVGLADQISQQSSGFAIEETGIQDTSETAIQSEDTTVAYDRTPTQSVDLDLVVPDDGDQDGDTYTVTIDTSESTANGIDVTGAAVENDPSGADESIEVVGSPSVDQEGNVTLTIREAAADQGDGTLSRETITVGLDLNASRLDVGSFPDGATITHVIDDEAGDGSSEVTYQANVSALSYANADGVVEIGGVFEAIDDWRNGTVDAELLLNVVDAWRSGDPVG